LILQNFEFKHSRFLFKVLLFLEIEVSELKFNVPRNAFFGVSRFQLFEVSEKQCFKIFRFQGLELLTFQSFDLLAQEFWVSD
jgi:hypothetical protein